MQATLPSSELESFIDPMLHPVMQVGKLKFKLKAYEELLKQFNYSSAGDLSMTVHGAFRSGKTTFMRYLIAHFEKTGKMLVFSSFQEEGDEKGRGSAAGMPRLARELRTSRLDTRVRSGSEMEALVKVVRLEAEKHGIVRILFIIGDLVPFVLLFAQPEVVALKQRLKDAGEGSLVDRFFLNMHRLRGLTQAEFSDFLREYDTHRWPEKEGPTYTQFFLPLAWDHGFRLAAHSLKFARAFKTVCDKYKRDADDIPTKYVTHAVAGFFKDAKGALASGGDLTAVVADCVRRSGIEESFGTGDLEKLAHRGKTRARRVAS